MLHCFTKLPPHFIELIINCCSFLCFRVDYCCEAWITAAVKPKVEDSAPIDAAAAAALHKCLFFPVMGNGKDNPEDNDALLGSKHCTINK